MTPSQPSDRDISGIIELQALAARAVGAKPALPPPVRPSAARPLSPMLPLSPMNLSTALRASIPEGVPPPPRRGVTLSLTGLACVVVLSAIAAAAGVSLVRWQKPDPRAPEAAMPVPPKAPVAPIQARREIQIEPIAIAAVPTVPPVVAVVRKAKAKQTAAAGDGDPFDEDPFDSPPAPAKPSPRPRAANDSVDALLGTMGQQREAAPPVPPPAPSEAREREALSRTQISEVMSILKQQVRVCGEKGPTETMAPLQITVAQTGRVSHVALTGPLSGTPAGACVEAVVQGARFPASTGLRFDYRLALR